MLPLLAILLLHLAATATVTADDVCNRTCGRASVTYPFGFSQGCPILLRCDASTSSVMLADFHVRNFTAESILLAVPPACERPVGAVLSLTSQRRHLALTWRNGLFLRSCGHNNTRSVHASGAGAGECEVTTSLISRMMRRTDNVSCGAGDRDNMTCVSTGANAPPFLTSEKVIETGCLRLFTSVLYDAGGFPGGDGAVPYLQLGTAEVGWWLDGELCAGCASEANCKHVYMPGGGDPGYRCSCPDGYSGDGYAAGAGCVRG